MCITFIARLLPYFIVERLLLKYTSDVATLKFSSGSEYSVNIYETGAGTWIVKSNRVELLRSRKQLESLISQIDEKLDYIDVSGNERNAARSEESA